jgi:hypothetical protein
VALGVDEKVNQVQGREGVVMLQDGQHGNRRTGTTAVFLEEDALVLIAVHLKESPACAPNPDWKNVPIVLLKTSEGHGSISCGTCKKQLGPVKFQERK